MSSLFGEKAHQDLAGHRDGGARHGGAAGRAQGDSGGGQAGSCKGGGPRAAAERRLVGEHGEHRAVESYDVVRQRFATTQPFSPSAHRGSSMAAPGTTFLVRCGDPNSAGGPMTYKLRLRTDLWPYADATRGADGVIEARRRYSEFVELSQQLLAKYAAQSARVGASPNPLEGVLSLPPLPPKVLFANTPQARGVGAGREVS